MFHSAGFLPVKVLEKKQGELWNGLCWTAHSDCRAGTTEPGWLNSCWPIALWTARTAKSKVHPPKFMKENSVEILFAIIIQQLFNIDIFFFYLKMVTLYLNILDWGAWICYFFLNKKLHHQPPRGTSTWPMKTLCRSQLEEERWWKCSLMTGLLSVSSTSASSIFLVHCQVGTHKESISFNPFQSKTNLFWWCCEFQKDMKHISFDFYCL